MQNFFATAYHAPSRQCCAHLAMHHHEQLLVSLQMRVALRTWSLLNPACLLNCTLQCMRQSVYGCQAERRPEEFGLPEMVQQYHSLVPLEDLQAAADQPSSAFGVCTMLLRAAAPQLRGQAVTLRRLDPRQASLSCSLTYLPVRLGPSRACTAVSDWLCSSCNAHCVGRFLHA